MNMKAIAASVAAVVVGFLIMQSPAQLLSQTAPPLAASTISTAQLIQPEELKSLLNAPGAHRPFILQVGSRVMFDQAHIPGSEFAGPGSRDEGLSKLRDRVTTFGKDTFIVLYCGCCPWTRCPNVGNASKALRDMGFTHVKVLYIADNFGTDWVNKGYPVAR